MAPIVIRTVLVVLEAPAVWRAAKFWDWTASRWYFAWSVEFRVTFCESTVGAVNGAGLAASGRVGAEFVCSEARDETAVESNIATAINCVVGLFIIFTGMWWVVDPVRHGFMPEYFFAVASSASAPAASPELRLISARLR